MQPPAEEVEDSRAAAPEEPQPQAEPGAVLANPQHRLSSYDTTHLHF